MRITRVFLTFLFVTALAFSPACGDDEGDNGGGNQQGGAVSGTDNGAGNPGDNNGGGTNNGSGANNGDNLTNDTIGAGSGTDTTDGGTAGPDNIDAPSNESTSGNSNTSNKKPSTPKLLEMTLEGPWVHFRLSPYNSRFDAVILHRTLPTPADDQADDQAEAAPPVITRLEAPFTSYFAAPPAGHEYVYQVQVEENGLVSDLSLPIALVVPQQPQNFTASAISREAITLTWDAVAGADNYVLYRGYSTTSLGEEATPTEATATFELSGPYTSDSTYYFTVTTKQGDSESAPAPVVGVHVPGQLLEPNDVRATGQIGAVAVTWEAVEGAIGYRISRASAATRYEEGWYDWTVVAQSVTGPAYTDTDVETGRFYRYRVQALDAFGPGRSEDSWGASPTIPPVPTWVSASDDQIKQITIQWGSVTNATSYDVSRRNSEDAESDATVLYTGITETSVIDTTIQADQSYSYAVRANFDGGVTSAWSTATTGTAIPFRYSFASQLGGYGSAPGQFITPVALVVTQVDMGGSTDLESGATRLLVLDSHSSTRGVHILDTEGTHRGMVPIAGVDTFDTLSPPISMDIDADGKLYIGELDSKGGRKDGIRIFDANGAFVRKLGNNYGSGPGQFSWPEGAAVDSEGNVYAADADNNRVNKFDANGNFLETITGGTRAFNEPQDVAVDADDNLYVADTDNSLIQVFDANGDFVEALPLAGVRRPKSIMVTESGNLLIADGGSTRTSSMVHLCQTDGTLITRWNAVADTGNFQFIRDVAMGPDQTVYVLMSTGHVRVFERLTAEP